MDVQFMGSEEWLLAALTRRETWFGISSRWEYFLLQRYDGPWSNGEQMRTPIGMLGTADRIRTPKHATFVSGATHAISDETTLNAVCRLLLRGGRRKPSRLLDTWGRDGALGPGPARNLPRSPLTYDENALLDLALTLWTTWGGKPQSALITHQCLMWLALEYVPGAARFVQEVAADRKSQTRRSTSAWVEMQYSVAPGDRSLFDRIVENNENLAIRRLRRLSPAALGTIAGLLEAMTSGAGGIASWLEANG